MAGPSSADGGRTAADVWKNLVSVPTRALCKRHMRATACDKAHVQAILHEYKRFFVLKVLAADFEDTALAAPPAVLQMWEAHVLDTAAYAESCHVVCGQMVHRSPDVDEDTDAARRSRRCHLSLALYRKYFGEPPPTDVWRFGELAPLSPEEAARLEDEAPAAKRRRAAGGTAQSLGVSVQAPFLPLRSLTISADASIGQLFDEFVRASFANHLVAGRRMQVPPTTRLRLDSTWLHDLQTLRDVGCREGSVLMVAVPQERRSLEDLCLTVRDAKAGDTATIFLRPADGMLALMQAVQDALGVPVDCQTLIFKGRVLSAVETVGACGLVDGSTLHLAIGKRRQKEAQLSPGGTWRIPD